MEIEREIPADLIDRADYFRESVIDDHVKEASRRAAEMPAGTAGDCQYCGDFFTRLVDDACGRCRDQYSRLV